MSSFQGTVVSVKNKKTAIVVVRRRARHPMYGKSISRTRRYPVHDPVGVAVGDKVEFEPCRPVSKTKRWMIVKIQKPGVKEVKNKNTGFRSSEVQKEKIEKIEKNKSKKKGTKAK